MNFEVNTKHNCKMNIYKIIKDTYHSVHNNRVTLLNQLIGKPYQDIEKDTTKVRLNNIIYGSFTDGTEFKIILDGSSDDSMVLTVEYHLEEF